MIVPSIFIALALLQGIPATFALSGADATQTFQLSSFHNTSLAKRDPKTDPYDFSWIEHWAAVGDSFTAGIGSGSVLSDKDDDIACSRYDYSYASIMNNYFGGSVKDFTYTACSGATTEEIIAQVDALPFGQDLIALTAGGNDLCLTSIIKACILDAITSQAACDAAINTASAVLKDFLQNGIDQLLTAIDAKMNKNGIVVYSLYGEYFNDQTKPCSLEDWVFPFPKTVRSLDLTTARRTVFNNLVTQVNKVLRIAVASAGGSSRKRVGTYVYADWNPWLPVVKGHFCEDGASPNPNDPSNANVHFFKFNTLQSLPPGGIVSRRQLEDGTVTNHFDNASVGLQAMYGDTYSEEAVSDFPLEIRGDSSPTCPKGVFALPDNVGKIFHPNELGHETMASFALEAVAEARAKILGITSCNSPDTVTCYQTQGSRGYAEPYALYSNTADFCSSAAAQAPKNKADWSYSKDYNQGTLAENTFSVQLSGGATAFDEIGCNAAVNQILDGCDGNDPKNPLDFKFGGEKSEGSYKYSITIKRTNRPWPPPTRPIQSCHGVYHGIYSHYNIYGQGWLGFDNGDGLKANISACLGSAPSRWGFSYWDAPGGPDDTGDNPKPNGGWEWQAWFNTPIWSNARCFNNYKVQGGAGGPTDSLAGEKACTGTG